MWLSNGKSGQSPTLIPNFSRMTAAGSSEVMSVLSPLDVANEFPRTAATATVTVGGSIVAGTTATITLSNPVLKSNDIYAQSISVTYTVLSTDTLDSVAAGLASLINTNKTARFFDVSATVSGDVITINWSGPVGNQTELAVSTSADVTLTASAGTLSGGEGPIVPFENFSATFGNSTVDFEIGNPYVIDYMQVTTLISQGFPII